MSENDPATVDNCVQFLFFKVDKSWRGLPPDQRQRHKEAFLRALEATESQVPTHTYSTLGLRAECDFMLWRSSVGLAAFEETLSHLLASELGPYLEVTHAYFGLLRRSTYGRAQTEQDHAEESPEKAAYFVLYPITKTVDWYQMSLEARRGMMGEHIRVGRQYESISQILLYSTGLGDQEFIVGYETDTLAEFQDLVTELRSTEARRHTLSDTPIFTCVKRTPEQVLDLFG